MTIGSLPFGRTGHDSTRVLFGAADAFQLSVQALGVGIPSEIFVMLPYILTVAALAGLVGRTRPPRKLGIAYTSEEV